MARSRTLWWTVGLVAVGVVAILVPWSGDSFALYFATSTLITVILVASLNLVLGYGGLLSLVQTGLFAIAAYASGVLAVHLGWPVPLAMLGGIVFTALTGAAMAFVGLRARHLYFGMATLAFDLIIVAVAFQWTDVTGGETGLVGIPGLELAGGPLDPVAYYVLCLAAAILVLIGLRNLVESQYGRTMRAVAQAPEAAESLAASPYRTRLIAFTIASAIAGLAGVLFVHLNYYVSPQVGDFSGMLSLFVGLFLGGPGTIIGPALGVIGISVLQQLIQPLAERQLLVYALLLYGVVILLPQGIMGRWREARARLRRSGAAAPPPAPLDGALTDFGLAVAATSGDRPLLVVSSLRRWFGGVPAVDGVDLEVGPATIHGLIGPNGSGKSTLVNLVTGTLRPDSGEIAYDGRTPSRPQVVAERGLIRVFQVPHLFPRLTVIENVMVGMARHSRESLFGALLRAPGFRREERRIREASMSLLASAGLAGVANVNAGALSHGQGRLLEVVRAIAARPSMLVLDEPASGLAEAEVADLSRALRELRSAGIGVLLIEHNVPFILAICDRITALDRGRVIADGTPDEVRASRLVQEAYLGEVDAVG